MATLSNADKWNLSAAQQEAVLKAKKDWEYANSIGDTEAMKAAHEAAEKVRAQAESGSYTAGASGTGYTPVSLGEADSALLNEDQQQQILALKQKYALETDQAEKDRLHGIAENIRMQAPDGGYTAGAGGGGYRRLAANEGGMTAQQMQMWLDNYMAANYDRQKGWTNDYSREQNVMIKADQVRNQMLANEQAMENADAKTQLYLHQQNRELAELLRQYTGGADSWYNDAAGRWETYNGKFGYGTYMGGS